MTIESHPLTPFLPERATILFLGSFPPPRFRWSMDFFYPNWINDFWRICGMAFFDDKTYFEVKGEKRFDKDKIVAFAEEKGLAFFDTASKVKRLNDDASDKFLEILEPTDVKALLRKIPCCTKVVTTGGKASEELLAQFSDQVKNCPKVGSMVSFEIDGRKIEWWRMPSSSRAYPLSIDKKAANYKRLWE